MSGNTSGGDGECACGGTAGGGSIRDVTEFEVFRRKHLPAVKAPAVTLMSRGQISINDAAFAELGSPKAVELMFSRADRVIGIRPVDPSEPHAYMPRTVAKNNGHGPYVVSGAAFMNYFGIDLGETKRYPVAVQNGTLVVDLKQPGTPVALTRSRQKGHAK